MASEVPLVVVVTGPPASGKSSIAWAIADGLPAPLLAKDPIKETLFDGLGTGDAAWSKKLGIVTYGFLFLLAEEEVRARRSCVLEANFDHNEASAQLGAMQLKHGFRALQIVCIASREVLIERFTERADSRHPRPHRRRTARGRGRVDRRRPLARPRARRRAGRGRHDRLVYGRRRCVARASSSSRVACSFVS
jgi:predicted kinase